MTNREYRLKGPYSAIRCSFSSSSSYLRIMWCYCYVLKADLALFRRPDLEKDKNKEQIWPGAVRLKIIMEIPSSVSVEVTDH